MVPHPGSSTKKCPFCAELIQAEAIICRYCQSTLVDAAGKPVNALAAAQTKASPPAQALAPQPPAGPPSIFGLLLWNLACPGLGVWKLGKYWRGGLILGLTLLAMTMWSFEAANIVSAVINKALRGVTSQAVLMKEMEKVQQGFWYESAFWIYLYSFVDLIYVYYYGLPKKTENS